MWLLLKEGRPDDAWNSLIDAQMAIADSVRAHEGFSHNYSHAERLEKIEQIVFPNQVYFSSGLIVQRQECSICGSEYGECDHLAGKPYWGEFCYIISKDITADHVAIVKDPADKRCRVTRFSDENGWRNRMTWRVELDEPESVPVTPEQAFGRRSDGVILNSDIVSRRRK